jgi:phospholipid/cholesterol/gamma-HCH transport system substrate-binding protein
LEPTVRALADVGPDIDKALAYAPVYPFGQNLIDRGIRGDYLNLFVTLDLTVPRLKRSLFLGTRWGEAGAKLVPAPGDPYYLNYTYEPLSTGLNPMPGGAPPADAPAPPQGQMPPVTGPVVPVVPPPMIAQPPPPPPDGPIFAGPFSAGPTPATTGGR